MYLKLTGCLVIVAATSGYGYSRGLEYQRQITDTGELERVIRQLAGEMEYTYAPLSQVCASVSRRCSPVYRSWLEHLAKELEVAAIWKPQMEESMRWQRKSSQTDGLQKEAEQTGRRQEEPEQSEKKMSWQMESGCPVRRLATIWEESCKKELAGLIIGKEERLRLQELGMQLGSLDKKQETQIFRQYAELLEEKRSSLLRNIQEKRRLCNLLGIMAGIFWTILIL